MFIKSTFSNRLFDWVVVITILCFLVLGFLDLFVVYENIHEVFLPRLIIFLLSLYAFLSFVLPKVNGERMTHLFIGGVLILPALVPLFKFVIELIFNQSYIPEYLNNPFLYFKLLLGLILLKLSLHFTKKKRSKKGKNFGIFITGLGFFVLLFLLAKAVDSIFKTTSSGFDLWEIVVKIVLGISIVITGIQIRYRKISFSFGLTLTTLVFILFFILSSAE